jgi:hypothetical protein
MSHSHPIPRVIPPSFGVLVWGSPSLSPSPSASPSSSALSPLSPASLIPPQFSTSWQFSSPIDHSLSYNGSSGGLISSLFLSLFSPAFPSLTSSDPDFSSFPPSHHSALSAVHALLVLHPTLSYSSLCLLELVGFFRFVDFPLFAPHLPHLYGELAVIIYSECSAIKQIIQTPSYRDKCSIKSIECRSIDDFASLKPENCLFIFDFSHGNQIQRSKAEKFILEQIKTKEKIENSQVWIHRISSVPLRQSIKLASLSPLHAYSVSSHSSASSRSSDPAELSPVDFIFHPWLEYYPLLIRPDRSFEDSETNEFRLGVNSLIPLELLLPQIAFQLGLKGKYGA